MSQCMATTFDNPNNPFTDRDKWIECDVSHGYCTDQYVAAFSEASSMMDDDEYSYEAELAVDRFLRINPFGMHYKVYEQDADKTIAIAYKAYVESLKGE